MGGIMLAAVSVSTNFRTILVYVPVNNVWCISLYQQILATFLCKIVAKLFCNKNICAKSFSNFFLQNFCKNKKRQIPVSGRIGIL